MEPIQGMKNNAEADASSHGISHVVGFTYSQVVHDRQHVVHPQFQAVALGVVGLTAASVAPSIHHDDPVLFLQLYHEAVGVPVLQAAGEAVLQHQWRAVAFDVVVDTHT
jgi:hypothetical protein